MGDPLLLSGISLLIFILAIGVARYAYGSFGKVVFLYGAAVVLLFHAMNAVGS